MIMYLVKNKELTDEQTRQYHRKRLLELSLKTVGAVPWLHNPSRKQKEWFIRRMKGSARSWEVWDQ
jgi:hypothetical protein